MFHLCHGPDHLDDAIMDLRWWLSGISTADRLPTHLSAANLLLSQPARSCGTCDPAVWSVCLLVSGSCGLFACLADEYKRAADRVYLALVAQFCVAQFHRHWHELSFLSIRLLKMSEPQQPERTTAAVGKAPKPRYRGEARIRPGDQAPVRCLLQI